MCTVTFLPLHNDGFILTSNRDESALRPKAQPPSKFLVENQQVYFPKDSQAGGTWISSALNGFTLCLLNGAFVPHIRKENYRLSRGLMLLDFYKYNDIQKFSSEYQFEGIEPFTLIVVDDNQSTSLYELKWDGLKPLLRNVNSDEPNVWSSVTLYEPKVIHQREKWFSEWLRQNPIPDQNSIIHFHEFGGEGDEANKLVMSRDGKLFTLSITSILKSDKKTLMKYIDLSDKMNYEIIVD